MTDQKNADYEAMFLVAQTATADLQGAVDHIIALITKHDGEIIAAKKWDERRLAYEICKQKRGVYILIYFSAPNKALGEIERECNLSDVVLRQLVIRADHLTRDEMIAADAREQLKVESRLRTEESDAQPADAPAETPA